MRIILIFIIVVLVPQPAHADFTLVTFNAEFLNTSKVHIKFGLKFRMQDNIAAEQAQWANPAFREAKFQEATDAVGS